MANTLDTLQPYVDQLFDDTDVQPAARARHREPARRAIPRRPQAQGKKKALQDRRLRRRRSTPRARRSPPAWRSSRARSAGAGAAGARPCSRSALLGAAAFVAINETLAPRR